LRGSVGLDILGCSLYRGPRCRVVSNSGNGESESAPKLGESLEKSTSQILFLGESDLGDKQRSGGKYEISAKDTKCGRRKTKGPVRC
jgi:hypothetical protein